MSSCDGSVDTTSTIHDDDDNDEEEDIGQTDNVPTSTALPNPPCASTKTRSLPDEAKTILCMWYDKHRRNPTKDEKQELLRRTGIEPRQLANWFANTRRKEKRRNSSGSKFRGVYFAKGRNKYSEFNVYSAYVTNLTTNHFLGTFHLESDAARAYDISARQLNISGRNFESDQEFERSREIELKALCGQVEDANDVLGEGTLSVGQKYLTYRGISPIRRSRKYKAILFHNLEQKPLGNFTLAADAAMAFDMEVTRLDAPGWPLNFDNLQSYKLVRTRELEERFEEVERDDDEIKSQWSDFLKVRGKDPAFPPYLDRDEMCDARTVSTNDQNDITSQETKIESNVADNDEKEGSGDVYQFPEPKGINVPPLSSPSNHREHDMVNPSNGIEGDLQTEDEPKMDTREEEPNQVTNAKNGHESACDYSVNNNSPHSQHPDNDDFEKECNETSSITEGRVRIPGSSDLQRPTKGVSVRLDSVDGEMLNEGITAAPRKSSPNISDNAKIGTAKGAGCNSVGGFDDSEIATHQDQYSTKKSQNLLMKLTTDQIQILKCPFPVGTLVWGITNCKNTQPVSFIAGQVVAVWMDLIDKGNAYEIQLIPSDSAGSRDDRMERIFFIPENRIVYAPECPVSIFAESWCPGRIIFCNIQQNLQDPTALLQPSYTVQLHRDHGVFQLVQGIGPGRLKYRKVNVSANAARDIPSKEVLSPANQTLNQTEQCVSQFGTQANKKKHTDDERDGDEIISTQKFESHPDGTHRDELSQKRPRNNEKFSPIASPTNLTSTDYRPQKNQRTCGDISNSNCFVSSSTCKDRLEYTIPRSGKLDRVDHQSETRDSLLGKLSEGKNHEYNSNDATGTIATRAIDSPKWHPPASRGVQTPKEVLERNTQKSSPNDKTIGSPADHATCPPKWHPPATPDVSTPNRSCAGDATNNQSIEEKERARSPSCSRATSTKEFSQKYSQDRESSERNQHCRVHFPKWLLYDNMAKDRLMYEFTKKSNPPEKTNMLSIIGQKTNCYIRIGNNESSSNYDRTHIIIESNSKTTDPTINVREAKKEIEDFLLKYIQHDGCQGRLFYDIGRWDKFFHPRSNVRHFAGSIAIMQRNPFSWLREMGWISVVELPFEVERNSHRLYHGHSLLGLMSRLQNEHGCFIYLCGNEFKRYPMKFGNPYVFIWGKRARDVDGAIEVILAELKKHRWECRRCRFEGR